MKCSQCGKEISAQSAFCSECGAKTTGSSSGQRVSKVALMLITFFLGGIGGHKFYTKKYVLGVIYFLFFWTMIPSLIALIEFIIYAFTSEEDLNARYEASNAAVLLVLVPLFFIFILGILAAIAIPNFIAYRNKAFCSMVESDANNIAAAVADYYAVPEHTDLPALSDLDVMLMNNNTADIERVGDTIVIRVTDGSGRCPCLTEGWDADTRTYTKTMDFY